MTCGEMATHRVLRTFRYDGDSHKMKVPACLHCATVLLAYPRYQRWCGFLIAALFAAAFVLFCLNWCALGTLCLLAMVPAGLHFLYYHWRFERDCLGIGKRFILLRVHADRFVQARDAALGTEESFPDWFERLRCEGESQTQIARRMEAFGYSTRECYETIANWERRRRSFYRLHGLRRFAIGCACSLVGAVGTWFCPPLVGVFFLRALGTMFGGLGQMARGTGYSY